MKYLSKSKSVAYRGVSGILTAYAFQGLVDHFGTIPYTNALQGEVVDGGVLTPTFDMNVGNASVYTTSLGYPEANDLDAKLNIIAIQKYISMNGTQEDEGWIETRRFDRPKHRLFTDGIFQSPPLSILPSGDYPASWLFPSTELSFNPQNSPAQRTITDKLFWDN